MRSVGALSVTFRLEPGVVQTEVYKRYNSGCDRHAFINVAKRIQSRRIREFDVGADNCSDATTWRE